MTVFEILLVATRLGLTSFGGPIAHVAYFRDEYVRRRGWVDDDTFSQLVALSQLLPGAASSKLGISIGILRAGALGGLAAWIGFTLPSALLLTGFALAIGGGAAVADWLHGLKLVAVAVVAQAVVAMARALPFDRRRGAIALAAAAAVLVLPGAGWQVGVIAAAGLVGVLVLPPARPQSMAPLPRAPSRRAGAVAAALFVALLAALPLARGADPGGAVAMVDGFYRAGALVFGGGHVVLPLLAAEFVEPGWIADERFVAGYGAAQAVPGPLFTFAAFLGASLPIGHPLVGAALALAAIFLPSVLLAVVGLASLDALRRYAPLGAAFGGISAAVVGLLLAALYTPVATTAVRGPFDVVVALAALGALLSGRVATWTVVAATAVVGALGALVL